MDNTVRGARLWPAQRTVRSGSEGGGEAPGGGKSSPACRPSIRTIGVGHSVVRYLVFAASILSRENFKVLTWNSWKLSRITTFVSETIISNQWPYRYSTTETCEVLTNGTRVITENQRLAFGIPANYATRMTPDATKKSGIYSAIESGDRHLENSKWQPCGCFHDTTESQLARSFQESVQRRSWDISGSKTQVSTK